VDFEYETLNFIFMFCFSDLKHKLCDSQIISLLNLHQGEYFMVFHVRLWNKSLLDLDDLGGKVKVVGIFV